MISDKCLATLNPELAKEWHPAKNKLTPFDVTLYSNKKIWWKCSKNHDWEAYVGTRSHQKTGCPCCSGRKAHHDNCLATLNPELAKEWHPIKNKLTPFDVTSRSGKKCWWKCSKGHEWEVILLNRVRNPKCPHCNCLATLDPELAKEWHPTKNKLTPFDVTLGSEKKIWWKCSEEGHEWEALICNRSAGCNTIREPTGCPLCSQSKNERNCKIIFEKIFNKPFPSNRKVFGNRMELDGYCEELELAFEYNGIQHYKTVPYWHRNGETLKKQQERDKLKLKLCEKKEICLIVIPYFENHRLEAFIRDKISFLNYI